MQRFCYLILIAMMIIAKTGYAQERTITGWRGDGSGRYRQTEPPVSWSKDSENILWKLKIEHGYSSPVLCSSAKTKTELLFLTAKPSELICIDAARGEIRWRETISYSDALGEEEALRIQSIHKKNNEERSRIKKKHNELKKSNPDSPDLERLTQELKAAEQTRREYERQYPSEKRGGAGNAAATVLCDGSQVYALFGTGIVTAYDLDGNRKWVRHLEGPVQGFGHSASPIMAGGRLIVHIQQMWGLDPQTGKTIWQAKVPAKFGTPAKTKIANTDIVITPSGAVVRAEDGSVLAENLFRLSENSPQVHNQVIYVHEKGKLKAFRLPSSVQSPFVLELLWEIDGPRDQRMASALYHEGLLYAGGRRGIMDVTDAETGEILYRERLNVGQLFSSPTLAGELIYFGGKDGKTVIIRPGRKYQEVAVNQAERYRTNPTFRGKRMYLRTDSHLYCIGK